MNHSLITSVPSGATSVQLKIDQLSTLGFACSGMFLILPVDKKIVFFKLLYKLNQITPGIYQMLFPIVGVEAFKLSRTYAWLNRFKESSEPDEDR